MLKRMNKLRVGAMLIMILTSIPLVIYYFFGTNPKNDIITHLHVYSGILFIIVAIINTIINKKAENIKSVNN